MAERRVKKNVRQDNYSKRRRKRRGKGTRASSGGRISYMAAFKQLRGDISLLRSYVNTEDKYKDVTSSTTPANAATLVLLNGLNLGTTATTRTGQSVKSADLQMNISFLMNGSAGDTFIRFMIFRDEQPNAAAPAGNDVLVDSTNFRSLRNVSYNTRFSVLHDEFISLAQDGQGNLAKSVFKNLGFHELFNTADNGTVADITKNSLYVLFISNETTNTPTIAFYSRYSFVDN